MALLTEEIGQCKRCKKFGPMRHVNHKQAQDHCKICQPIVEQDDIDWAIRTLKRKGVTPEMYQRWIDKSRRPVR